MHTADVQYELNADLHRYMLVDAKGDAKGNSISFGEIGEILRDNDETCTCLCFLVVGHRHIQPVDEQNKYSE